MESELEFGTTMCVCPKCGFTKPHTKRGVPCSERKCPLCGAKMKGEKCAGV